MTIEIWADNTTGTLSAPALATDTTIGVSTSTGTFPTLSAGEVFHIVINFATITAEIVEVTNNAAGTFTLAAGLAHNHDTGEPVACVITKEGLDSMVAESVLLAYFTAAGDLVIGTGSKTVDTLPKGTSGQVLTVGGVDADDLEWASPATSLPPNGAAGGQLGGTYPNPTVVEINGVAVTGTPTAGQVPTASTGTAAAWATPSSTPTGTAGGDLGSTYPNPTVVATHLSAALPVNQGGSGAGTFTAGLVTASGTSAFATVSAPSGAVVGTTDTQTLTNKRLTRRVLALSANATAPAIDTDNYDVVHITAQTATISSFTTNLTGTPVDGDSLHISITGTASVPITTWGASFEASTIALPTTTSGTTRLDVGFVWNTETSAWRCAGVA